MSDEEKAAAEAERARVRACADAIEAALQQFGCALRASPVLTPEGRVSAVVDIVAK